MRANAAAQGNTDKIEQNEHTPVASSYYTLHRSNHTHTHKHRRTQTIANGARERVSSTAAAEQQYFPTQQAHRVAAPRPRVHTAATSNITRTTRHRRPRARRCVDGKHVGQHGVRVDRAAAGVAVPRNAAVHQ